MRTATEIDLNDMRYAEGARYDARKGCLPGTRKEVIDEISNWVNNDSDDTPRIFFLTGFAGAGKSAIAHAVAHLFDGLGVNRCRQLVPDILKNIFGIRLTVYTLADKAQQLFAKPADQTGDIFSCSGGHARGYRERIFHF